MSNKGGLKRVPREALNPTPHAMSDETQRLFRAVADANGKISSSEIANRFTEQGIAVDDPRLLSILDALRPDGHDGTVQSPAFVEAMSRNGNLLRKVLRGDTAIPAFREFEQEIVQIFERLSATNGGQVATYIPQLARVDPDRLAVSICTVDGQRLSMGDADTPFCLQSMSKPISYCIALEEHGEEVVHSHVGREPSGRGFNELTLNADGLPHNPLINSGAIMVASLIRPKLSLADRFEAVMEAWKKLSGGRDIGFNNPVYLSERQTADRNFALGYFMREKNAFPSGTDLTETLEFYFQLCSIEMTCETLSIVAASLASGGICPITGEQVFETRTVQNCLSLMGSSGMYDFSGEFAFSIGLPAKSGVSGGILLVVPGLLGAAIWSPKLDRQGNSVRGIQFCKELVSKFNFHAFDGLRPTTHGKLDPRLKRRQAAIEQTVHLCWAASEGDVDEVQRLFAAGADLNACDYDGRTALHLAAAEGRFEVVRFLADHGVGLDPVDRWGSTPADDAKRAGAEEIAKFLRSRIRSATKSARSV